MSAAAHARRFRRELIRRAKATQVMLIAEGADGAVGYARRRDAARGRGAARARRRGLHPLCAARRPRALASAARCCGATARVLEAQGATSLMLFVLSRNERARGFYERLGGEAFARGGVARLGRGPDRDRLSLGATSPRRLSER